MARRAPYVTPEMIPFYAPDIPDFLARFARTPLLQRLQGVGMSCGVEYTHFARFAHLPPYSRYQHSLGVALIVWHHTHDPAAALAGLCHDVATPAFAHTVDFLFGDAGHQEYTEQGTLSSVGRDRQAMRLLDDYGVSLDALTVAHYPVAECPSPRLCADRLEYTLGDSLLYGFATLAELQALYDDLTVGDTPDGAELVFRSLLAARRFGQLALSCGEVYAGDEDRYAMQILSELLAEALRLGVLTPADLYTTDAAVIARLQGDERTALQWRDYASLSRMRRDEDSPPSRRRVIPVKRRYVDPYVLGQGRLRALDPSFDAAVRAYLTASQSDWLCGE